MSLLSQPLRRRSDAPPGLVLAIVCAGVVLASLDLFVVNVALPQIARDLHEPNLGNLSWVLNAYAIVYAAALVLLGRLAEGRRRDQAFLLGVVIFTAASAACGVAGSLTLLVIFRILQAVGAALLTPSSLSLVLATSPPDRRPSAVRAWTALGGLAAALGPVAGGLLVAVSWRWVFYVNVPIGIVALVVGWRRLPAVPGHPVPRPDALAALLITGGVAALALGLVKGNDWGWGAAATVGSLAAAVLALALFALHTARHPNPLIEPALFRVRAFTGSSVVSVVFSVAFGAMLLSVVLFAEDVWHWSALQTGLGVAPGPLMVPAFAFLVAGRLIARIGPGRVIGLGATVYAAGVASWALRAGATPDYADQMLPGMLLTGIGVGLTLPTFMSTGASALPAQSFATGSAVINMLRQVGLAVGVAILVAVIGTPKSAAGAVRAFDRGWTVIAATAALAALSGSVLLRMPRGGPGAGRAAAPVAVPLDLP